MIKIFNKLNSFFLHDKDEKAPLKNYILFYGWNGALIIYLVIIIILNITF